jgi:hypothetical protein
VGDALRAALVPVHSPGILVLDSTGRVVDLDDVVGGQVVDGGVLHVVRPAPAPRRRSDRWAADRPDVVSRRPAPHVALALAGAVGGVLVAVMAVLPGVALDPATGIAAAALALAALATALSRSPAPAAATISAPALAAGAAALAVALAHGGAIDGPTRRLAVTAALVAAGAVAAVRLGVTKADGRGDDDAAVALGALVVAAAVQAAVLLTGAPPVVVPALLAGAAPLVVRLAPRLALRVPDDQLIDLAHVSRTAASVRAPRPRGLGRVAERRVVAAVRGADRRATTAIAIASALPVVLMPAVLVSAAPRSVPGSGALALAACLVVALALGPRTARGAAAHHLPRASAALVLVETAALGPVPGDVRMTLAVVAVALALVTAAVALLLLRGWRSVVVSRLADAVESLAVVLALPAAAVAAGLVEILRRVTSG